MGIALLALTGLFKTFSGFKTPTPSAPLRSLGRIHPSWAHRTAHNLAHTPNKTTPLAKAPGLRVLRVHEAGDGPQSTGRMVISGRMADVCAELDRLAALEMRHQTH